MPKAFWGLLQEEECDTRATSSADLESLLGCVQSMQT